MHHPTRDESFFVKGRHLYIRNGLKTEGMNINYVTSQSLSNDAINILKKKKLILATRQEGIAFETWQKGLPCMSKDKHII